MQRRRAIGVGLIGLSLSVMVGVALATPGSGVTAVTVGSGMIDHAVGIHQAPGESVVISQVTFEPGGTTGWHSHPGKTVVVVQSGSMTLFRDKDGECSTRTYGPGEGFVEKRTSVHMAVNEGDEPLVVGVAYFRVGDDGVVRIDQPDPGVCTT